MKRPSESFLDILYLYTMTAFDMKGKKLVIWPIVAAKVCKEIKDPIFFHCLLPQKTLKAYIFSLRYAQWTKRYNFDQLIFNTPKS